MAVRRVLVTGAAGFIASYIMPGLQGRYDLTLLDVSDVDREGRGVEGVVTADLTDPDRSGYQHHFEGIDAVIHLGHKSRRREPLDDFHDEIDNVRMVYNVLRCAYDASVPRVAVGSSNHAADWYEHFLIHERKMEVLDPYAHPLSDNFYGWAKASYEHLGFLFACGFPVFQDSSGREIHVSPKPGAAPTRGGERAHRGAEGDRRQQLRWRPSRIQARPGRVRQRQGPGAAVSQGDRDAGH